MAFASQFGAKIILLHATYLGYVYSRKAQLSTIFPACKRLLEKCRAQNARARVVCELWNCQI